MSNCKCHVKLCIIKAQTTGGVTEEGGTGFSLVMPYVTGQEAVGTN